jgi:DNA-binding NarL/FixJ family response regulator
MPNSATSRWPMNENVRNTQIMIVAAAVMTRPVSVCPVRTAVARGDALLSPAATRGLISRFLTLHDRAPAAAPGLLAALTDREREIVALVATGMSNAEIAEQLFLSPLTVKTHANHAMAKLGARDRAQLVITAYETGLVRPGLS